MTLKEEMGKKAWTSKYVKKKSQSLIFKSKLWNYLETMNELKARKINDSISFKNNHGIFNGSAKC